MRNFINPEHSNPPPLRHFSKLNRVQWKQAVGGPDWQKFSWGEMIRQLTMLEQK